MHTLLGGMAFALLMVAQVLAVIAVRASGSDEAQLGSPTARTHPRPRSA